MNSTLSTILALLPIFFSKNPTVMEIEAVLPQIMAAIDGAKAGTAFSVSFPESIDGKAGTSTFGWSPTSV
jgi:hypothetical protein